MRSLREALSGWRDADDAAYHLSVALGLFTDPEPFGGDKQLFWTNNPIANMLYAHQNALPQLVF